MSRATTPASSERYRRAAVRQLHRQAQHREDAAAHHAAHADGHRAPVTDCAAIVVGHAGLRRRGTMFRTRPCKAGADAPRTDVEEGDASVRRPPEGGLARAGLPAVPVPAVNQVIGADGEGGEPRHVLDQPAHGSVERVVTVRERAAGHADAAVGAQVPPVAVTLFHASRPLPHTPHRHPFAVRQGPRRTALRALAAGLAEFPDAQGDGCVVRQRDVRGDGADTDPAAVAVGDEHVVAAQLAEAGVHGERRQDDVVVGVEVRLGGVAKLAQHRGEGLADDGRTVVLAGGLADHGRCRCALHGVVVHLYQEHEGGRVVQRHRLPVVLVQPALVGVNERRVQRGAAHGDRAPRPRQRFQGVRGVPGGGAVPFFRQSGRHLAHGTRLRPDVGDGLEVRVGLPGDSRVVMPPARPAQRRQVAQAVVGPAQVRPTRVVVVVRAGAGHAGHAGEHCVPLVHAAGGVGGDPFHGSNVQADTTPANDRRVREGPAVSVRRQHWLWNPVGRSPTLWEPAVDGRALPETNQLVLSAAASRRGHTARLRQVLNDVGVLPYYTFVVKGYRENQFNYTPLARLVQEEMEEKVQRRLPAAHMDRLQSFQDDVPRMREQLQALLREADLPFLSTDRSVLNLPAVGKSLTFRTIGITRYGRRIRRDRRRCVGIRRRVGILPGRDRAAHADLRVSGVRLRRDRRADPSGSGGCWHMRTGPRTPPRGRPRFRV